MFWDFPVIVCINIIINFQKKKVLSQLDKLEKQNKQLAVELKTCKTELDRIREENVILRDANIQFQVKMFKLNMQVQNKEVETSTPKPPPKIDISSNRSSERTPVIAKVETCFDDPVTFDEDDDMEDMEEKNATMNSRPGSSIHNNTGEDNDDNDTNSDNQYERRHYKIDPEFTPRRNESQTDIQNRFKIKLGPMKLAQLNNIDAGY